MRINELIIESTEVDEGWFKNAVAGAALGAAALGAGNADAKSHQHTPAVKPTTAHTQQVQKSAQQTPAPKALSQRDQQIKASVVAPTEQQVLNTINKPEAKALISAGKSAGMRGAELAQFVAQCAHETADFTRMVEKGGKLDFKKYDPKVNPRKAKILGNKVAGDGAKFHGRGYIQLTGRDNYDRAGKALGLDLVNHPELVERPDIAAKVAVWFWQTHVQPKVSDWENTAEVTKPINSGLHGLDQRKNMFASIMKLVRRA